MKYIIGTIAVFTFIVIGTLYLEWAAEYDKERNERCKVFPVSEWCNAP